MFGLSDLVTKIIAGSLLAVTLALGVMLMVSRAETRHWQKEDALHLAQRDAEIAKNTVNLRSIADLTAALDAKNAESDARAKAYADAKEQDAKDRAAFDKQETATDAARARLEAIARVPGSQACRAPKALTDALTGL